MKECPCGSGKAYEECCEPFIEGKAAPSTAEALMRSRYTAYTVHAVEYIIKTCVRKGEQDIDVEQTRRWAEQSKWLGLTVLKVEQGGVGDSEGMVEFAAVYEQNGLRDRHHEKAHFKKEEGVWLYDEGSVTPETIVRASPKVGRNEPCPCGSGKKYKHCCGSGRA